MVDFDPFQCAHAHLQAWVSGTKATTRHKHFSPPDLAAVYAVHDAMGADALAAQLGGVAGYKQGGIGAAVLPNGTPAPAVYGVLMGRDIVAEGSAAAAALSVDHLGLFCCEAEIGFRMRAAPGADGGAAVGAGTSSTDVLTEQQVWDAVDEVFLAVELCGRRHALGEGEAEATSLECLGDASCAAAVVCGRRWAPSAAGCPTPAQLAAMQSRITVNGEERAAGEGANCPLGSPLAALTWVANHLVGRGKRLLPGDVVIGGATCKTREWSAGDTVVASFGDLGEVRVCVSA